MKFNNIVTAAKSFGGRVAFKAKDKSPELFFIGGVVSMGLMAYKLWNAKTRCEEITEEYKQNIAKVEAMQERVRQGDIPADKYTPKQATSDKRKYGMKAAVAFAKVIVPIALLGFTSIGCFGKTTTILKGRNAVSAAVIAKQNQRIKELEEVVGEDKLKEIQPKSPKEETDKEKPITRPPHTYWFDERSENFIKGDPESNRFFLSHAQDIWTDELHRRTKDGQVKAAILGNEVIQYLDIKTGNPDGIVGTQEGAIMGWSMSKNPEDQADGYISFGCFNIHKDVDFGEPILLEFNFDATPVLGRSGMSKR